VSELRGLLTDAARAGFGELGDGQPGEPFYGFAPELSPGSAMVAASANTVVVPVVTGDPADVLELARDVNPAVPFARLQAALG